MSEYHKIQSVYKRDEKGRMLFGEYSTPEIAYLANEEWCFTEKIDGTNIRVIFDGQAVSFGGRTERAQLHVGLLNELEATFRDPVSLEILKQTFPDGAILYGEGYGKGVQKGGGNYKADGQGFCLFDVKVGSYYLGREAVAEIAGKFDIPQAKVICCGTLPIMVGIVKKGLQSDFGPFEAEGIVARPMVDLFDRRGDRIITKIKAKDFAQKAAPAPVSA